MNKRFYELLRNLENLAFIEQTKLQKYYDFLKEKVFVDGNEKEFMDYYYKTWLKKYKDLFNYHFLINDIIKLKIYI